MMFSVQRAQLGTLFDSDQHLASRLSGVRGGGMHLLRGCAGQGPPAVAGGRDHVEGFQGRARVCSTGSALPDLWP